MNKKKDIHSEDCEAAACFDSDYSYFNWRLKRNEDDLSLYLVDFTLQNIVSVVRREGESPKNFELSFELGSAALPLYFITGPFFGPLFLSGQPTGQGRKRGSFGGADTWI